MRSGGLHDIKSSLPLAVSLYFNWWYSAAFFVVTLLLLIYKGANARERLGCCEYGHEHTLDINYAHGACFAAIMLPYPQTAIGLEVAFVFLYAIIESIRLYLCACQVTPHWARLQIQTRAINASKCSSACGTLPAGERGNKTEAISPLVTSLLLALAVIIFHAYYIRLQTYV